MATLPIASNLMLFIVGVAGRGAEDTVTFAPGTKKVEVFALAQDLTLATTATGTGAAITSTTIPAGTGLTLVDYNVAGLPATLTVYILQASAAGTAQFTVQA